MGDTPWHGDPIDKPPMEYTPLPAPTPKRTLRDESTPIGRQIWAAVDKAAARAPLSNPAPNPSSAGPYEDDDDPRKGPPNPTPELTAKKQVMNPPEVRETTVVEWHLTSHMLRQLAEYQRELAKWVVMEIGASAVRRKAFEKAAEMADDEGRGYRDAAHRLAFELFATKLRDLNKE